MYFSKVLVTEHRVLVLADRMVNYETQLLDELMSTYNRHARPIANVLDPIDVSIGFYLTKILGLVRS